MARRVTKLLGNSQGLLKELNEFATPIGWIAHHCPAAIAPFNLLSSRLAASVSATP